MAKKKTGHALSTRYIVTREADLALAALHEGLPWVDATLDEVDAHGWRSILVTREPDVKLANTFIAGWYAGRKQGY